MLPAPTTLEFQSHTSCTYRLARRSQHESAIRLVRKLTNKEIEESNKKNKIVETKCPTITELNPPPHDQWWRTIDFSRPQKTQKTKKEKNSKENGNKLTLKGPSSRELDCWGVSCACSTIRPKCRYVSHWPDGPVTPSSSSTAPSQRGKESLAH